MDSKPGAGVEPATEQPKDCHGEHSEASIIMDADMLYRWVSYQSLFAFGQWRGNATTFGLARPPRNNLGGMDRKLAGVWYRTCLRLEVTGNLTLHFFNCPSLYRTASVVGSKILALSIWKVIFTFWFTSKRSLARTRAIKEWAPVSR